MALLAGQGTVAAPSIAFQGAPDTGFYSTGTGYNPIAFAFDGVEAFRINRYTTSTNPSNSIGLVIGGQNSPGAVNNTSIFASKLNIAGNPGFADGSGSGWSAESDIAGKWLKVSRGDTYTYASSLAANQELGPVLFGPASTDLPGPTGGQPSNRPMRVTIFSDQGAGKSFSGNSNGDFAILEFRGNGTGGDVLAGGGVDLVGGCPGLPNWGNIETVTEFAVRKSDGVPATSTNKVKQLIVSFNGGLKAGQLGTYVSSTDHTHELVNSTTNTEALHVQANDAAYTSTVARFYCGTNTTSDQFKFISCDRATGGEVFRVFDNGDVENALNSYTGISDERLKQDIVDAGSQWDDVKSIPVRKFRFKKEVEMLGDDAFPLLGVIAQEVAGISPGLVKETKIYEDVERPLFDTEGDPMLHSDGTQMTEIAQVETGETQLSVKYSILYMKAVKALQEAMERIETLEAKVEALGG